LMVANLLVEEGIKLREDNAIPFSKCCAPWHQRALRKQLQ
jgi:hypothetical protein